MSQEHWAPNTLGGTSVDVDGLEQDVCDEPHDAEEEGDDDPDAEPWLSLTEYVDQDSPHRWVHRSVLDGEANGLACQQSGVYVASLGSELSPCPCPRPTVAVAELVVGRDIADSDEVARSFRFHVAHHSGMMSPFFPSAADG